MCVGALPLAVKAFGGSNKTAALSMLSPALAIGSALGGKKTKSGTPVQSIVAPSYGPSPSGGY